MPPRFRPGCLVRSTIAFLGVFFLPFSIWSAWIDVRHNWPSAIGLFLVSLLCLWAAFDKSEGSPLSDLDDL